MAGVSNNNWHHLIATYNGTHKAVYIDGLLNSTKVYSQTLKTGLNTGATIGSYPGGGVNFNGRMDELMIFNRSLSAEQINSIYQDGLANHSVTKIVSQETKVGENWSVMVTPNDLYGDGTQKLSHNLTILSTPPTAPNLNLNSSSGTNLTSENLTVYISGSTDAEGNSIYNVTDWRINGSSLAVLNMPFDNNDLTKARDYSVYGNNGTVAQTNWYSNGKVGGTYDFNSNGYINIPATNDLDVQNLTISLWFNTTNRDIAVAYIFEKGNSSTQYLLFLFAGSLYFRTINATGNSNDLSTSMAGVSNNNWHHLIATYNGTHKAVYIDGLLNSTGIYSDTLATGLNTGATIGSHPAGGFNFNGRMDELMIFNRSLSAQQIASIYHDGLENHSITKIVSQETKVGENWSVMVTPNDLYGDGTPTLSHNLTIKIGLPTAHIVNLNTTSLMNSSVENLTVFYSGSSDPDMDPIKNVTDWRINGSSIAVLNYPFETQNYTNVTDYSTYRLDGKIIGNVVWTSNGRAGGAYNF